MGRDKVNPKPIDHAGFATLLKGANDVLRRHQEALRARLHRSITCTSETGQRLRADLDIQLDEDDPHAVVSVVDEQTSEIVRRGRANASFKLSEKTVHALSAPAKRSAWAFAFAARALSSPGSRGAGLYR
jgi:hypothetical protein